MKLWEVCLIVVVPVLITTWVQILFTLRVAPHVRPVQEAVIPKTVLPSFDDMKAMTWERTDQCPEGQFTFVSTTSTQIFCRMNGKYQLVSSSPQQH